MFDCVPNHTNKKEGNKMKAHEQRIMSKLAEVFPALNSDRQETMARIISEVLLVSTIYEQKLEECREEGA